MAVKHGKAFQVNVNSQSWEEYLSDLSFSMDIDTAEVTTSGDAAKTYVEGDYGASWSFNGPSDYTDSTGTDELAFGLIGGGAVTVEHLPGSGAAAATNPSKSASAIMTNFTESCSVSDANRSSYAFTATGAVTRAES